MNKIFNFIKSNEIRILLSFFVFAFGIVFISIGVRNKLTFQYKTSCENLKITDDSLGLRRTELRSISQSIDNFKYYQDEVPISSKVVSFELCDSGFLEIKDLSLSYGKRDNNITLSSGGIDFLKCSNCKVQSTDKDIRIDSENENALAVVLIRANVPGLWKYIYYFERLFPYILLISLVAYLFVFLGNYSTVFRVKMLIGITLTFVYFYIAGRLRGRFESGPIDVEKMIGHSQYNNLPQYYDFLSFSLLLGLLFLIFFIDIENFTSNPLRKNKKK